MNKKVFDSFSSFETERLIIRPFEKSDFYDYVNWHDCNDIIYYNEGLYAFKSHNLQGFEKFFLQTVPRMYKTKKDSRFVSEKRYRDTCIYAILKEEYSNMKGVKCG